MGLCILTLMFGSVLLATYNGSPIIALMPETFKFARHLRVGLVAFGSSAWDR